MAGAHVSIPGYAEEAVTNEMGNFALPAHAAGAQMVQVGAQKGQLGAEMYVSAARTPVELVLHRP